MGRGVLDGSERSLGVSLVRQNSTAELSRKVWEGLDDMDDVADEDEVLSYNLKSEGAQAA